MAWGRAAWWRWRIPPAGISIRGIRGICYISRDVPEPVSQIPGADLVLPAHSEVSEDLGQFAHMFKAFYENADPVTGKRLYQKQDTRYLVQNPPALPLLAHPLDRIYELLTPEISTFLWKARKSGGPGYHSVFFDHPSGVLWECRFCAITVHQGRHVSSRSEASIVREARGFLKHPHFKGIISNVGGPTANMYGFECGLKKKKGACKDKGCLFPKPCKHLPVHHGRQIHLLKALARLDGIRKVFVGSGVRYDLILGMAKWEGPIWKKFCGITYLGQLKIAPEHVSDAVLNLMGKPGGRGLEAFFALFNRLKSKIGGKIFLTYYLMAAHPGCTLDHMRALRNFAVKTLHHLPEQVQIFTPTPATYSTLMYFTKRNPFTGQGIFVEKSLKGKEAQKQTITGNRTRQTGLKNGCFS